MPFSVFEAYETILRNMEKSALVAEPIHSTVGHRVEEPIRSDRCHPPFDRVAMDGIAIQLNALESGIKEFVLQSTCFAGDAQHTLKNASYCIEVATGSILPSGADLVLPYEVLQRKPQSFEFIGNYQHFSNGSNVHKKGSDCPADETVLRQGTSINGPVMGLLATFGKTQLITRQTPKIIVLGTGTELVPINQTPKAHQLRSSNALACAHSLRRAGFTKVDCDLIQDNPKALFEQFKSYLLNYDVIISSGGISKGPHDFLLSILKDIGAQQLVYRIQQKPGKPMWFGKSACQTPIFCLPGNPLATMVCLHRYVIPALQYAIGSSDHSMQKYVALTKSRRYEKPKTLFQLVKIKHLNNGLTQATPVSSNGSSDIVAAANSDGFIELPADQKVFGRNQAFRFFEWY